MPGWLARMPADGTLLISWTQSSVDHFSHPANQSCLAKPGSRQRGWRVKQGLTAVGAAKLVSSCASLWIALLAAFANRRDAIVASRWPRACCRRGFARYEWQGKKPRAVADSLAIASARPRVKHNGIAL